MKPAPFRYHAPRTGAEALAILADVAPQGGRVLAGGQSLVPMMALRLARPEHLVDINAVAGFDRLAIADGSLQIGPCVRHADLGVDAAPGELGRLLAKVGRHIAHLPIRRRGTFCGSLVNADPSSEWCLLAVTLGAEMVARALEGERLVAATDFIQGIMATALEPHELLAEVRIPLLPRHGRAGFFEYSRRAGDYAQAMALAVLELRDGVIEACQVGLGAVEHRPRRLPAVEAILVGQRPSTALFRAAAEAARPGLSPMDVDPYRLDLSETVIRRALHDAAGPDA